MPAGRVIIIGAGPTGLALACELALAGTECLVLERRAGLRTDSRAVNLHARSMELLDLRGQASRFAAAGLPVPAFPLGPTGARIPFGVLHSDFPYLLDIPQSTIEELLAARAAELGVTVGWSRPVTGIEQDGSEVRVTADGGRETADYVVGCDGIRSFARESLGIPFPGAPNPGSVILADLHVDGLPADRAHGELSQRGMLLVFPFRDGSARVVLYDYSRAGLPVTEPVTFAEVTASLAHVAGRDLGPRDLRWSGRYRSESRQVPCYRSGRVFLAGDAAHTHSPAGAQGLNLGLQDAMNLGWKLGAAVAGWAPPWLLDSYDRERRPVGAAVLALTGRQFWLNTARTRRRRALRWAAHRLAVPLPGVRGWLAREYSGVAVRYPVPPGSHPQAGRRLPPGTVVAAEVVPGKVPAADGGPADGPAGTGLRLADLFRDGRFVLLERASGSTGDSRQGGPAAAGRLPGPVRAVRYRERTARLPPAALVRPDGYVAWASGERDPARRAALTAEAVRHWCTPG